MPTCDKCGRVTKTDSGLAKHILYKHPPEEQGDVYQAAKEAVDQADHLGPLDQPAIAVLLKLASIIDGMEKRSKDAPMDNVTIPTFLKYADALGLTPLSRQRLDLKPAKKKSALDQARERWGTRAG